VALTIFTFHRVALNSSAFPAYRRRGLVCTANRMIAFTARQARRTQPIALSDALTGDRFIHDGRPLTVFTFDDGFREHAQIVGPRLSALGITATFFLSSEYLGGGESVRPIDFFYHLEEFALEKHGSCSRIRSEVGEYLDATCDDSSKGDVARRLRYRTWADVGEELERIAKRNSFRLSSADLRRRLYLNSDLARQLLTSGMELGAHGCSHRPLSALCPEEQQQEISESISAIASISQSLKVPFAYPFGGADAYNRVSVTACRRLGASCGCTSLGGSNGAAAELFELRRQDVSSGRRRVISIAC